MERGVTVPGGNLERAVLRVLWGKGAASVREIHTQMRGQFALGYTTIATILDRLHAKKLVSRRRAGLAFVYRPRVPAATVERALARRLVERLLDPEPRPAIARLVDAVESYDPQLLDALAREVARRRSRRGP